MRGEPSFWRLAGRSFALQFGGVWLLVGVGLLGAGLFLLREEMRYADEGERAAGVVVARFTTRSGKETRYRVNYEFTTAAGQVRAGSDRIGRAAWQNLREGATLEVEYLRSNPGMNRLAGGRERAVAYILPSVGGVAALAGGLFFLRGLRRIRTIQRLRREGVFAEGTVLEVKQTNMQVNRVRQWVLEYSYVDYRGQSHRVRSDHMPPEEAAEWRAGEKGAVRYDQSEPATSVWLGREKLV
jgi:hypothetical protein